MKRYTSPKSFFPSALYPRLYMNTAVPPAWGVEVGGGGGWGGGWGALYPRSGSFLTGPYRART